VGGGYAVAIYGGSIVAVSLRRAKERILYEDIMRSLSVGVVPVQRMFFAEELILSMDEYELLESYAEEFAALGFEIEYRGEGSISVSGRPAVIDIATPLDELLYELLNNLSQGDAPMEQQRTAMAELMAERGCRGYGEGLCSANASELLHQLEKCVNPSFTPSGNPIMAEITLDEIRSKLTKK
jgi:DNA mismatch repair protein MutL